MADREQPAAARPTRGLLRALCCAGAATLLPLSASGVGPALAAQGPVQVEVGGSREVLSGGNSDWEDYWVRVIVQPAPRTQVYGGVRHTRRFDREDQQIESGARVPLGADWTLGADGTWSPTHRILPRWGARGSLHRRLPDGWGIFFGGGREVYDVTGVNREHVGVERYIADFRFAYRIEFHQLDVGGSGVGHLVTGSWFYAGGSDVTVGLGAGRRATILGLDDIRAVSRRSASLSGTHWLDDSTGVTYILGADRHGDAFTSTTAGIGIRRRL